MKNFAVLLSAFVLIAFFACNEDADDTDRVELTDETLVGEWRLVARETNFTSRIDGNLDETDTSTIGNSDHVYTYSADGTLSFTGWMSTYTTTDRRGVVTIDTSRWAYPLPGDGRWSIEGPSTIIVAANTGYEYIINVIEFSESEMKTSQTFRYEVVDSFGKRTTISDVESTFEKN